MRRSLLAAPLLLTFTTVPACGPAAPAPIEVTPSAPAEAAKAAAPAPAPAPEPAAAEAPRREPPLTPEEIELIESDPKTLTPELNRKRAHALRRKIMQTPDSPQAKQLEQIRRDVESGALVPQVVPKAGDTSPPATKELVLKARPPTEPAPTPEKAP